MTTRGVGYIARNGHADLHCAMVRYQGQSGKHVLALSFFRFFDPDCVKTPSML